MKAWEYLNLNLDPGVLARFEAWAAEAVDGSDAAQIAAALNQEVYRDDDIVRERRATALGLAVKFAGKMGMMGATSIVDDAAVFEAYLNGGSNGKNTSQD